MRLLQLNAWQGRLKRVLLKQLETSGVDIACMQEIVNYDKWSFGLVGPSKSIQEALGCEYSYMSPLMTMEFNGVPMKFGNAIYSKFPLEDTSTNFTRGQYTENYDHETMMDYNIRAFQHAVIKAGGTPLHIINHHGHHIDAHKNGDEETERQMQMIADYISHLDGAVIVCGDFNLAPESASIQLLSDSLRNLAVEYGLTTTRSKLTTKKEVCDYIFVNDQVNVENFYMIDEIISDHNGLVIDFSL